MQKMINPNAERLWARVEGRVQGVAFRYFVRQRARDLGIKGWVRNCRDGSVEVVAEADAETLERLFNDLHRGPPGAVVRQITPNWTVASGEFMTFLIKQNV